MDDDIRRYQKIVYLTDTAYDAIAAFLLLSFMLLAWCLFHLFGVAQCVPEPAPLQLQLEPSLAMLATDPVLTPLLDAVPCGVGILLCVRLRLFQRVQSLAELGKELFTLRVVTPCLRFAGI